MVADFGVLGLLFVLLELSWVVLLVSCLVLD